MSRWKYQRHRADFTYTSGRCPRLPDTRGRMEPEDEALFATVRPDKRYIDNRGWLYMVLPGLSSVYKARYRKPREDTAPGIGWKCIRQLPWRDTREEAQADLDALAQKKGWTPTCQPYDK